MKKQTTNQLMIKLLQNKISLGDKFVNTVDQNVYLICSMHDGYPRLFKGTVNFYGPNGECELELRDYSDDGSEWFKEN